MFGKGLLTGMSVTLKHFFGKKETFCYPEEKLPMTERFRGGHLKLDVKKCIGCQLCSMACPNAALKLTVKTDENKKRYMGRYVHDMGRCLYCNLCIERCAVKALKWDQDYEISTWYKGDLMHHCFTPEEAYDAAEQRKKMAAAAKAKAEAAAEKNGTENAAGEVKSDAK